MSNSERNSVFINELSGMIDKNGILFAYQNPRKNARIYAYGELVSRSCGEYFRWRDGSIYVFNGRYWVVLSFEEFKYILRESLVLSSGSGSEVIKGDWVDKDKKIVEYALDGIKCSPLQVSPSIVGFTNGVYDFSDVSHPVRHSFGERLGITQILPYAYDPDARCPLWDSFLHTMLPSRDVDVLQKFFGLAYVPRLEHSVESSLWLIGSGANGKSTIERMLPLVFGNDSVSHTKLESLIDRNTIQRLLSMGSIIGRKFNICEEISGSDIERGSDLFKSLVSGQSQQYRFIGRDIYESADIPFLIFTMNKLPENKRMDEAFRRRMVKIYFRSSVRQEDMDRDLVSKLAGELSGICNWVIEGYRKLVADNYRVSSSGDPNELSDEDVDMMINNGHTVDAWASYVGIWPSRHVGHDDDETSVVVPLSTLYCDYESFCRNNLMIDGVTSAQFGRDMHRLCFEWKRRSGGAHYRVYCDKRNKFNQ